MRFLFSVFFLFTLSCSVFKGAPRYKEGRIILDNSGNGVFIPKDKQTKDIVQLFYKLDGDSVNIWSEYSNEHITTKIEFTGDQKIHDSLEIKLHTRSNYPLGFAIVEFYNSKGELIQKYSTLDKSNTLHIDPLTTAFQLNILGAKSDLFILQKNKRLLNIYFDHLSVNQAERYTVIDEMFDLKKFGNDLFR